MGDITSRPYRPSGDWCCEACVFGRGEHAEWCSRRRVQKFIEDQLETGVCAFANEVFRRQRLELETHSALRETFGVSSS
jgi:hypothetical protein